MMARLARAVALMVGRGRIKTTDDSGMVQKAQVEWGPLDKNQSLGVKDGLPVLGLYGLASRPPVDSDAVILFLGGEPTDGVVIATGSKADRLVNLLVGEAALVNQLAGTWLKLRADGNAELNAEDLIVDGISFKALVAAHNGHRHSGVQTGPGNTGTPDQTV